GAPEGGAGHRGPVRPSRRPDQRHDDRNLRRTGRHLDPRPLGTGHAGARPAAGGVSGTARPLHQRPAPLPAGIRRGPCRDPRGRAAAGPRQCRPALLHPPRRALCEPGLRRRARPAAGRDRPRPPPFRRAGRSGEPSSFPPLAGRARARGGDRLPHQRGERGGRRDPRRRGARFPAGHAEARGRRAGRGDARPPGMGDPALARHPCRPAPHAAHPALSQGGEGRRETLRDGLRPVRGGGLHGAPLRGHLAMALFSMLVAGSFPLGAMMANAVSPVAFTALRFLLSGVIIGVAVLLTTGLPRQAARAPWRYAVLGGLFAAYFVLMFEGLKTAAPVSAAAVFTLTPIVTAGFGFL